MAELQVTKMELMLAWEEGFYEIQLKIDAIPVIIVIIIGDV